MIDELPANWAYAPLAEVCQKIVDGSHNPPSAQPHGVAMLSARNIENCQIVFDKFRYISREAFKTEHARTRITHGDVLLTIVGTIGRAAVVQEGTQLFALQRSVAVLKPTVLMPRFCMYQLQAPHVQRQLTERARGTAQKGIYLKLLGEVQLKIPPMREQERIVAEIEKQFTRLDAAVAALKRVQANLKRYRASVLKAACEGRLVPTEAELARRERRPYEPASVLLERILAERRTRWEAGRSNSKKGEYKIPRSLDRSVLPALPEGWEWVSLGAIAELKGGLTKGQKRKPTDKVREVPYLRVANVQRGYLDLTEIKTIDATPDEIEELRLVDGDVLFNEGGDRDKLGRGWVWEGKIHECIHQNHVFRARVTLDRIRPKFLSWYGNSIGQKYFEDEGKQTTNLASLNMTKLSMLPVPLPPAAEQKRIVSELARRLSVIDELEVETDADLKRSERLRQSTLKRAFQGKLVPQDPNDGPASALLERIHGKVNPGSAPSERNHKISRPMHVRQKGIVNA